MPAGRPEWVCLADSQGYRTDKPSIGYSDLKAIGPALQTPSGFTADTIVKVLQEVGELEHFNKIVSIELLFSVLRDQTRELAAAEMRTGGSAGITHPHLAIAVTEATTAAQSEVQSRLQRYQTKGSVTPDQAILMGKALSDIITDCADGGPAQSYYEYLKAHTVGECDSLLAIPWFDSGCDPINHPPERSCYDATGTANRPPIH